MPVYVLLLGLFNNGFVVQWGYCRNPSTTEDTTVYLPIGYTNPCSLSICIEDWDDLSICGTTAGYPSLTSILVRQALNGYRFGFLFHWTTIGFIIN